MTRMLAVDAVHAYLQKHCAPGVWCAVPHEHVKADLKISLMTVARAIRSLEGMGRIEVRRQHGHVTRIRLPGPIRSP